MLAHPRNALQGRLYLLVNCGHVGVAPRLFKYGFVDGPAKGTLPRHLLLLYNPGIAVDLVADFRFLIAAFARPRGHVERKDVLLRRPDSIQVVCLRRQPDVRDL